MTQHNAPAIQGLYEVCIGVRNPKSLLKYWKNFGYGVEDEGDLSASLAQALYGVESSLHSIRLDHLDADHGLIRLMVWDAPSNDGLGMQPMKIQGNRWASTLTAEVNNIWNHAVEAERSRLPLQYIAPQWTVIYPTAQGRPFRDPLVGVREMLLLQPLTRQVLFERFNYTVPHYGQVHFGCLFQTSQVTHMGLVIQDDSQESLRFYDEILGLYRVQDNLENTYETAHGGRSIFEMTPQEKFWVTAFDVPHASIADWESARSGRLYIVRFPEDLDIPTVFEQSRPGCLGMSLYTYRVHGLDAYRDRIQSSTASQITQIIPNEFGERSFSFQSPDGYTWTLLEI